MSLNRSFRSSARLSILSFVFLFTTLLSTAQQSSQPTVLFTCDFPGSDPAHYGVSVSADGTSSYISEGKLSRDSDTPGELATTNFNLSHATVSHIFDLAKAADYFSGNLESKKKKIASTGDKNLSYTDGARKTSANYNYSENPSVQELTTIFQHLAASLEFGRRLDFDYHYQKLALDDELKRMEDAATRGDLVELPATAPVLAKIMQDASVINASRARAQRLLAGIKPAGQ